MYNNEIVNTIKPLIFTKKLNDSLKTVPLNKTKNTLGPIRYFPPANQEWFNSIYAYNSVYTSNITIADKNLSKLIKSYFNIFFNKKLLYSKRILTRFRRLAINKIFISKAELKHTSSKITITLYVYNEERRILLNRLKRIEAILFPNLKYISGKVYKNNILSLNNKFNIIKRVQETLSFMDWLEECKKCMIEEINLEKEISVNTSILNTRSQKSLKFSSLEENVNSISSIIIACKNDPLSLKYYENIYGKFLNKTLLEKELIIITYFKLLLSLNKAKFEDKFLFKLKPFIKKIYNKQVEFNIVNLKAIYLNSDIFTQAISLKLRNRNNRLLTVLRYFLYMVKLPKINFLKERFAHINIKNLWVNRVKNLTLRSLGLNLRTDSLNILLRSLFTNYNFSKNLEKHKLNENFKEINNNLNVKLLNNVLNDLKYKSIGGVRLEAKGRLTRRFTASRSVFKIKWKGSLKNIDSSYKGFPSVILRGHVKSNVQCSIINSKTRNGAFGIKGWISGK